MTHDRSLDDLRREIDAIDDRLHDALVRRTEIVGRISALKRRGDDGPLALRPGREARILRRLAARHRGAFPLPSLLRMWRELLAGQVSIQGEMSVGVVAAGGGGRCRDLARDHFGSATPLREYSSNRHVIHDVWRGNIAVGVIPVPDGGDHTEAAWWRLLASNVERAPRIVARLPFWSEDTASADPAAAWAVAKLAPEETGDDATVAALERVGDVSRDRLRRDLGESGLKAETLAVWRDPDKPERTSYLIVADGFFAPGAPPLRALAERFGEAAALGSYARPIRLSGEAPRV